ncbi:hypothetical protein RB595_007768 [Gaeumannomyces hyphopodioides]
MTPLEDLDDAVFLLILDELDSPVDIKSLLLSSKVIYSTFKPLSGHFYRSFATRMDTSPLFRDLRATLHVYGALFVHETGSLTFWCLSQSHSGPSAPYQDEICARKVFSLVDRVDQLGYAFFRQSAPLFFNIQDDDQFRGSCRNSPSATELYRLRRAFFRYQLYCETLVFHTTGFRLSDFFGHLRPWQVAEVDCVQRFVQGLYERMLGDMETDFFNSLAASTEHMARKNPEDFICLQLSVAQVQIFPPFSLTKRVSYSTTLSTLGLEFLRAFENQPRKQRNQFVLDTFERTCQQNQHHASDRPPFYTNMRRYLYNDAPDFPGLPPASVGAGFRDTTNLPNFAWNGLRGMVAGGIPGGGGHFATRDHGWALWDRDILKGAGQVWVRVFLPTNMAGLFKLADTVDPRKTSLGILSLYDFGCVAHEFVVTEGRLIRCDYERMIKVHRDALEQVRPKFSFAGESIEYDEVEARHGCYWESQGKAHLVQRMLKV